MGERVVRRGVGERLPAKVTYRLGRKARASALVGQFAWSKTQEEDELVEVPNEDSEAVAAVLVVIRRDCGLLVLCRLIHNSV